MKRKSPGSVPLSEKRLLSIDEFRTYTSLGRNSALKLSIEAKCRIQCGKRILIDRVKFDEWSEKNCK